jgi:hypothetical protein
MASAGFSLLGGFGALIPISGRNRSITAKAVRCKAEPAPGETHQLDLNQRQASRSGF